MPVPYRYPEQGKPSSKVIQDCTHWQDRGILVPHETIRWMHIQMREVLKYFKPHESGQEWKTKMFFTWLKEYYGVIVHDHHGNEEKVYNPWLVEKGATMPGSIAKDHVELTQSIDAIAAFEPRILAGEKAAVPEFVDHMRKLMDHMDEHFVEEETTYPNALRECKITEAEEGAIVGTIVQSMGLHGNKIFLPPLLYAMHSWGGPDVVKAFRSHVPGFILFLHDHFWSHDFKENHLEVLEHLKQDDKPNTGPACRFFC